MWGACMAGCSPTRPPPAASTGVGVAVTGAASLGKACFFASGTYYMLCFSAGNVAIISRFPLTR